MVGFKATIETGGFQGLNWNWWVSRLKLKLVCLRAWIWWGFTAWIDTGRFLGFSWNWSMKLRLICVGLVKASCRLWRCNFESCQKWWFSCVLRNCTPRLVRPPVGWSISFPFFYVFAIFGLIAPAQILLQLKFCSCPTARNWCCHVSSVVFRLW